MSKAMELADELDGGVPWVGQKRIEPLPYQAAAELRRLAAVEEELKAIKALEPFGYFCDWGNDAFGLQRIAMYYGGPGSATEDDWNEYPSVHQNLKLYALPEKL